jgi:hypothetical protein
MRKMIGILLLSSIQIATQAAPPKGATATQTNAACSVNAVKSNVTIGTLTCTGIDLAMANELKLIADGTRHDAKLLGAVLDQLKKLSAQLKAGGNVHENYAPYGFAVSGGTLVNPSVNNNFGPVAAKLVATEEIVTPASQTAEKVMRVHIKTDRAIPGAWVGVIFSGSVDVSRPYWEDHMPKLYGVDAQQIDIRAPLFTSSMVPIPNSMYFPINMPSAFSRDQDFVIEVRSKDDVHVANVFEVAH